MYIQNPNKNFSLINPNTGTPSFGVFPYIKYQGTEFVSGHIYLRYGQHKGPNRGFGLEHIWKEHFKKIITINDAMIEIPKYVSGIIQKDASIHSEFGIKQRNMIFKSKKGLVILEPFFDGQGDTFYSIVTAYNGQAKGPKIGAFSKINS